MRQGLPSSCASSGWHLILGVALWCRPPRGSTCGRYPPPSSCESGWDEKHKHTRSDNVAVAVAVSTVAVVVRQLVRGNAVADIVFVPRYHIKPRKVRFEKTCVDSDRDTKRARAVPAVQPATLLDKKKSCSCRLICISLRC